MTPKQVRASDHKTRMMRLRQLRDILKSTFPVENSATQTLMDEAILIVLRTFKLATKTPPYLPERPLDYLRAFLWETEPDSFLAYLKPRAMQWVQWCEEYEDKNTAPDRKRHLKKLLSRVGAIGGK